MALALSTASDINRLARVDLAPVLDRDWWLSDVPTIAWFRDHGLDTGWRWMDEVRPDPETGMMAIHRRMTMSMGWWFVREEFVKRFSFAIPARDTIAAIAAYSRNIVEVGAGTGFWAMLLRHAQVDIVATDHFASGESIQTGRFCEVLEMSGDEAVLAYPDRDVLCVWPYLTSKWLAQAARQMEPGRLLFFVGEGSDTCGHQSFHDLIEDPNWFVHVETVPIVQFPHIHDRLVVLRKHRAFPRRDRKMVTNSLASDSAG